MATNGRNPPRGSTHLLQRSKSVGPFTGSKSAVPKSQRKLKLQATVILYVNENCPLHGPRGNCNCSSFVNDDDGGVMHNDGMGSSDSPHRSGDYGQQQQQQQYGSNDDFASPSVKPFYNNPALPITQRDIVGNNLHFNSSSTQKNDQLAALLLYRDTLKRNLTTPAKAGGGFPRMRHGRIGSQWRHIKQTNTYSGSNLMFIDGSVRIDDSFKYPIPHFGYPPLKRPQHIFSASYNDLSTSNPATQSFDTLTWSATDALNRRPSLSQYSNRFQNHAKDNFPYSPTNLQYKKPKCKPTSTGTYQTWLGLSNADLKS